MRRGRTMGVLAAAVLAGVLAGCTSPASRIDEYQIRAERIHAELLAVLPSHGDGEVDTRSRAWFDEAGLIGPTERDAGHWASESTIELDEDAAAAAAAALSAHLVDEGWTAEPTVEQGGTFPHIDVYRLAEADGEWIVQVGWDDDRDIALLVQSPVTLRGAARD